MDVPYRQMKERKSDFQAVLFAIKMNEILGYAIHRKLKSRSLGAISA